MIFVTLGSQKFQFNRLLKALDCLVAEKKIAEEIFAQTGYSDYQPEHYGFKAFMDREEFAEMTEKADIVITHGGTGAIIGAVKKGKKVIAVPRKAEYEEHIDNHQQQLVEQFQEMELICGWEDCDRLDEAIAYVKGRTFRTYHSNTQRIIDSIDDFLSDNH